MAQRGIHIWMNIRQPYPGAGGVSGVSQRSNHLDTGVVEVGGLRQIKRQHLGRRLLWTQMGLDLRANPVGIDEEHGRLRSQFQEAR